MKILHIVAGLPLGGGFSESVPALCVSLQRLGTKVSLTFTQENSFLKCEPASLLASSNAKATEDKSPSQVTSFAESYAVTRSSKVLKLEETGVRVVTFRRSWPQLVYFSWGMLMGLGKEVREADTVHVHGCWTFPVWWGGWLALRYKKTLVMSPRGALNPLYLQHSAWKKRLVGWMDRWLLRRASVVHATCGDEKRWVQAFLKVKSEKLKAKNINTNVEHSTLNIQHPRGEKPRIVVIPNGVEEVH